MRARKRPTCVQVFTPARSSALCTQYTHAESEFSIFPYTPSCSAGCPPYNSYANTEKPFYFFVMHVLTSPQANNNIFFLSCVIPTNYECACVAFVLERQRGRSTFLLFLCALRSARAFCASVHRVARPPRRVRSCFQCGGRSKTRNVQYIAVDVCLLSSRLHKNSPIYTNIRRIPKS